MPVHACLRASRHAGSIALRHRTGSRHFRPRILSFITTTATFANSTSVMSSPSQNPADTAPDAENQVEPPEKPVDREAWRPDGVFRCVDPNYVTAARIGSLFTSVVLAGFMVVVSVITAFAVGINGWRLAAVASGALLLAMFLGWLMFQYPRWEYKHIRYSVSESGIEIHRGILWRGVTNVPRSRIQHTDVTQGPVARRFGIATLQIYTAGTENNEVDLEGVAYEVALSIRDYLVRESRNES